MSNEPGITFSGPLAEGLPQDPEAPALSPVAAAAMAKHGALACYIELNGVRYPGKLPLYPRRMLLILASHHAGTHWTDSAEVSGAVIGFCWRGAGLDVGDWRRDFNKDVEAYGEMVLDRLMMPKAEGGWGLSGAEIAKEAGRLMGIIEKSIPSQKEIDETREDFTESPPENSSDGADEATEAATEPLAPPTDGIPMPDAMSTT